MFDRFSIVDMFGPFCGDNWHPAELRDGLTYRWMGPAPLSSITLSTLGARHVRIRILLAFHPQEHQLANIKCEINGREVVLHWAMRGLLSSFWSDIELPLLSSCMVATISTPPRIPTEPGNERALGLAISRIEIFALSEMIIGEQNTRFAEELDRLRSKIAALSVSLAETEKANEAIIASTSWKVSKPIRSLKSAYKKL